MIRSPVFLFAVWFAAAFLAVRYALPRLFSNDATPPVAAHDAGAPATTARSMLDELPAILASRELTPDQLSTLSALVSSEPRRIAARILRLRKEQHTAAMVHSLRAAAEVSPDCFRSFFVCLPRISEAEMALKTIFTSQPHLALHAPVGWLAGNPQTGIAEAVRTEVISAPEALQLASQLPFATRGSLIESIIDQWLQTDAPAATVWVARMSPGIARSMAA